MEGAGFLRACAIACFDLVAKLYGTRVFDRKTRMRVSAEVVFTHALYGCTR